jgi:chromosome segregation ATPase
MPKGNDRRPKLGNYEELATRFAADVRAQTILMEEMRSQNQLVVETVTARSDALEARMDEGFRDIGSRVDVVEGVLRSHSEQFRLVDARLTGVETRLSRVEDKVDELDTKVQKLDTKVQKLDAKVDELDTKVQKLDAKVERLETRVDGMDVKLDKLVSLEPRVATLERRGA